MVFESVGLLETGPRRPILYITIILIKKPVSHFVLINFFITHVCRHLLILDFLQMHLLAIIFYLEFPFRKNPINDQLFLRTQPILYESGIENWIRLFPSFEQVIRV